MVLEILVLITLLALSVFGFIMFVRWVWAMEDHKFNRMFSIFMLGVKPHEEAFEEELAERERLENQLNEDVSGD
jgi:hypothetical protein